MKLVRFSVPGATPEPAPGPGGARFGWVRGHEVVSFERASTVRGGTPPELAGVEAWLAALPGSLVLARSVAQSYGDAAADSALAAVRIHPPVPRPPALFDFGLSPRHLRRSALTLIRHEWGPIARACLVPWLALAERRLRRSAAMPYYKGNHNAVIGDGDSMGWPAYTSYLDIEPELAVIAGTESMPIAGYTILNDASARDVQMPEMFGSGPARSKDFDHSKGLGPFLVTPDEIPDPLALDVRVRVGERFDWHGSTREYTKTPEDVIRHLRTILSVLPGTVVGMGTIPDCTGLDHDTWIRPGEGISIHFDRLGTLHQQVPAAPANRSASRWRSRRDLGEEATTASS